MVKHPVLWNPSHADFSYYALQSPEGRRVRDHVAVPVTVGLVATVGGFFALRLIGGGGSSSWLGRRVREAFSFSSTSKATAATRHKANQAASSPFSSGTTGHLAQQAQRQEERIRQLLQVPLEFTLSVVFGSSLFFILFNAETVQDDVLQAPLLPGRKSLVHECICPPIVDAVVSLAKSSDHAEAFRRQDDNETLQWFARMAQNCRTRSRFIERRQALGLENPELVPQPGLRGHIPK